MTDITAVLVLRRGGADARAAMASLREAAGAAAAVGLHVQVVVVAADGAADGLEDLAGMRVVAWAGEEEGEARNRAVAAAHGAFVAFMSAGDLWGLDWLRAACVAARGAARRTVWHPEATLFHGEGRAPAWAIQPDGEMLRGDWVTLAMRNHWTASSFAAREIHLEVPYAARDWAWSWNAAVVAAGCVHRPVQGTAHVARWGTPPDALPPGEATLWRDRVGWGYRVGLLGRGAA